MVHPAMSLRKPVSLAFALFCLPALSAAGQTDDPTLELAQSYARQALIDARSPRSAASVIRLQAMRDKVEDLTLLAQTYRDLIVKRGADPSTQMLARIFLRHVQRARGHLTKAAEINRQLGFLHDFYIAR